jgi:hypothetical protein
MSDQLITFFEFSENQIIDKIKHDCRIDDLIFTGLFEPAIGTDKHFGFFEDVAHHAGEKLIYPEVGLLIDSLFVPTDKLDSGKYYTFTVKLAKKEERLKKNNPFLLQAKAGNIQEIIRASELQTYITQQQTKLNQIENSILAANDTFNHTLADFEAEKKMVLESHLLKLEELSTKYIQENERVLAEQTRLNELTIQTSQMEDTLELLRQKVNICQNLNFLTKEEVDRYLVALDQKPFKRPEKYLNFKDDLQENYPALVKAIHNYLHFEKGLIYTEFQIRNFLVLLLTHDIIVLSGLSGSGKTQIVKAFAEAVGGVAKIIPVKPSWTSSDDLLGYYNPLQSSFMPTPFTEALVEAAQNPHRLYLICLDEMNLARVEYYFADFLSKLEEREHQPEIELYAKHEEEMFTAEFKTMLSLIESAIGSQTIGSWVDFLTNDLIRTRFFELVGASEKDTVLQIHANMKKRLVNILKFPATLKIPANVRFIGAINVDETTHYFSPKILDRVHIVKFDNPLLFEEEVNKWMEKVRPDTSCRPIYVDPNLLVRRESYPALKKDRQSGSVNSFIDLNKQFLIPLNIDFGIRSLRQAANYYEQYCTCLIDYINYDPEHDDGEDMLQWHSAARQHATNSILNQKILSRFVLDGDETTRNGEKKIEILEKMANELAEIMDLSDIDVKPFVRGPLAEDNLRQMIASAHANNNQVNFFA